MASQNTASRPYPADYRDYRNYLQQMVAYLKATHPRFSYRYFSRLAGYSSPNFLKLVAEGHRNMSIKSIVGFARVQCKTTRKLRYRFDGHVAVTFGHELEKVW